MYDRMMRRMRNKGWLETGLILKAGIDKGTALEVGPGPGYFDGVFTNGSLHEWAEPKRVFNEIHRVLNPGGNYCTSDLRRDMHPFIKWFMKAVTEPKEMRPGLIYSIRAAYTAEEVQTLLGESDLDTYGVDKGAMGITITGQKTG